MSRSAIIIPARWASTRFPGKPLHPLAGKPLVQHVWEKCLKAKSVERVIIATDDMRIAEAAFAFGAEVSWTSPRHPSGTDRAAEVAKKLTDFGLIVNVQGDEPFVDPKLIDRLVSALKKNRECDIATAACSLAAGDIDNPNSVKVVTSINGRALYFSRCFIPADRDGDVAPERLRHIGIYAYRRKFLLRFVSWKPTPLELSEKLEQLRALEHGSKILVLKARATGPGVDTPEDALAAERALG